MSLEDRVSRLEEVVSGITQVPDDAFSEDVDSETSTESDSDEGETCGEVKSDGEVCGREKPCPYHDEE